MSTNSETTEKTRATIEELYRVSIAQEVEDAFPSLVDDDVVVHEPSYLPYAGEYKGRDNMLMLFGKLAAIFDPATLRIGPMVVEGEYAVVEVTLEDRATKQERRIIERFRVRNGRVVELLVTFFNPPSL